MSSSADDTRTITVALPGWLKRLRPAIEQLGALYDRYGSVPAAVFGLIALYIASAVLSIGQFAVNVVLAVFDPIVQALGITELLIDLGVQTVTTDLVGALVGFRSGIADVAAAAGPLAPVIVVGVAAASLYVVYRVSIALLGELPLGSSLVDLLGLR